LPSGPQFAVEQMRDRVLSPLPQEALHGEYADHENSAASRVGKKIRVKQIAS